MVMSKSERYAKPYLLYYDTDFVFDRSGVLFKHDSQDEYRAARVTLRVDEIEKSLRKCGAMWNPIIIYMKSDGRFKVHPGKCRVRAARRMGWTTVPAVIIDKYNQYPQSEGGVEVAPADAVNLFTGDQYVHWHEGVFVARIRLHKFQGEKTHAHEDVRQSGTLPPPTHRTK